LESNGSKSNVEWLLATERAVDMKEADPAFAVTEANRKAREDRLKTHARDRDEAREDREAELEVERAKFEIAHLRRKDEEEQAPTRERMRIAIVEAYMRALWPDSWWWAHS
jgi:hypothetical protein